MPELKTYVCPNCGANTTNAQNCEYCGSLLVRFVEKGIDIKSMSYFNRNDWVLPGLIENLQENLQLQKSNPSGTNVQTDIYGGDIAIHVFSPASKTWTWSDGMEIDEFSSTDEGLIITFTFFDYRTNLGIRPLPYRKKLSIQDQYKQNFKNLELHSLFLQHESRMKEDLGWGAAMNVTYTEYAIDFGQDAEGAARLISRILLKVYGISKNDKNILITTNAGDLNIEKGAEENLSVYTGIDKDYNNDMEKASEFYNNYNKWYYVIVVIIIIFWIIIDFVGC